jgi:hypothetical protein
MSVVVAVNQRFYIEGRDVHEGAEAVMTMTPAEGGASF